MDFSRLFLGCRELDNFLSLSIREGFISSYSYDAGLDYNYFNRILDQTARSRVKNKSSLLRMLLLFENIDSNGFTDFDISRFIDNGLICEESNINNLFSKSYDNADPRFAIEGKLTLSNQEDYTDFVKDLFFNIDKRYNTYIFDNVENHHLRNIGDALAKGDITQIERMISCYKINEIVAEEIYESNYAKKFMPEYGWTPKDLLRVSKKFGERIVNKYIFAPCVRFIQMIRECAIYSDDQKIENCMQLVDNLYTVKGKNICSHCDYKNSTYCLEEFECENSFERYVTLLDVYAASELGLPVYSTHLNPELRKLRENVRIVDDIYYLMKLPALNQLNSLPTPQSITEALHLRNRPEIISFRNIFKIWCESLQNYGDEETIKLITKDFAQASIILEKQYNNGQKSLYAGHAIKQNLLSIILEIPGFFIPFFSLLLDLPEPWINRRESITRQKSEWFLLTR